MTPLRAFTSGVAVGIMMVLSGFLAVGYAFDIRFRVVSGAEWRQQEADRHYGCSQRQADPATGECR